MHPKTNIQWPCNHVLTFTNWSLDGRPKHGIHVSCWISLLQGPNKLASQTPNQIPLLCLVSVCTSLMPNQRLQNLLGFKYTLASLDIVLLHERIKPVFVLLLQIQAKNKYHLIKSPSQSSFGMSMSVFFVTNLLVSHSSPKEHTLSILNGKTTFDRKECWPYLINLYCNCSEAE